MPQTPPPHAFLRNVLLRLATFLSIVFLAAGLVFLLVSHFGWASHHTAGVTIVSSGAVLAILSLVGASFVNFRLDAELKEAGQIAARIAEGDTTAHEDILDDEVELQASLKEIALYLAEKAAVAERIAAGDLSAEIPVRSDRDRFGEAFQNMIDRLRVVVQTEEERDLLQKSVMKLLGEVSEVAAGDLTVSADTSPEITGAIAGAFNSMTAELRSLIGQVKQTAFQVSDSATAISDTTEQLARGSEAQSSQISLTTAAISGMAGQIQEVSDNALLSSRVAADSLANARYGSQAVQNNIGAMNAIRKQVQETARRIKKLGERSQEISQTVGLIDDLSDRTGLLALNASLQAAAAGESGRGFAQVADEVERLAERSNRLTRQIADLAQSIQAETKDVVASMEETIHEVVVGSALADKAGQTLVEIEQVSRRLAELIQSISEAARRQAQSSEDISKAMANISKVTELVQLGSKRAADSVKMLVALSDELGGAVAPFKLPNDRPAAAGRRRLPDRSPDGVNPPAIFIN